MHHADAIVAIAAEFELFSGCFGSADAVVCVVYFRCCNVELMSIVANCHYMLTSAESYTIRTYQLKSIWNLLNKRGDERKWKKKWMENGDCSAIQILSASKNICFYSLVFSTGLLGVLYGIESWSGFGAFELIWFE